MKNKSNFLIIIVILVLIGASYYFFEYKPGVDQKKRAKKESVIFNFNKSDIVKIDLENDKGQVIFEKDKKGAWDITYPEKFPADNNMIKNILSHFSCVYKKESLGNDADLHKFELDKNYIDLKFYLKTGESESLHIGDTTPSGDCNYAKKESSGEIMLICSSFIGLISKPPIEYKNRSLWQDKQEIVKNNAQKVVIKSVNGEIIIEKTTDGRWTAKKGTGITDEKCKEFVDYLAAAESTKFIRAHKGHMKISGLIDPEYKIEVYCKDIPKPLELIVGKLDKMRDSVWVKYGESNQITGLDHEFLTLLENLYK